MNGIRQDQVWRRVQKTEEEEKLFKVSRKTARTPRKVLEERRLLKGLLELKKLRDAKLKKDKEEIRGIKKLRETFREKEEKMKEERMNGDAEEDK